MLFPSELKEASSPKTSLRAAKTSTAHGVNHNYKDEIMLSSRCVESRSIRKLGHYHYHRQSVRVRSRPVVCRRAQSQKQQPRCWLKRTPFVISVVALKQENDNDGKAMTMATAMMMHHNLKPLKHTGYES